MANSTFVISLDFELFWGVADKRTVAGYGRNVLGEWDAIPRLLSVFRAYGVRATWATVGMIMCRDYRQWREIRPSALPTYARVGLNPYHMDAIVKEHPDLFFSRDLVQRIAETPGQEVATHTYSHFYCGEPGVTVEQFAADLACAAELAAQLKLGLHSIVFPRNQIADSFLTALPAAGVQVYRGNRQHWLYRNGDEVAGGLAGRAVRFADSLLPLSGRAGVREQAHGRLLNLPASMFLYPCSARYQGLLSLRLARLKAAMTAAARSGGIFHLWWHPHNFGLHLEENLALLEEVLRHYRRLADCYGMQSRCMGDFDAPLAAQAASPSQLRPPQALGSIASTTWSQP